MDDVVFGLPALLLTLLCLIYSITVRRRRYLPLPKSPKDLFGSQHAVFLAMLCVLLILSLLGLAQTVAGATLAEGAMPGVVKTASVVVRGLLLILLIRYATVVPKADRGVSIALTAVVVVGMVLQVVLSVPLESFFAAVAAFGCMVTLERDREAAGDGMSNRFRAASMIVVALIFLAVMAMNVVLTLDLTRTQSEEMGRLKLDVICDELQHTLSSAEQGLLHVAIRAERLIDTYASREEIEHLIVEQRESFLADESFMNLYIAGADWHIVPGFDAPPDFHAAERLWYIGALEHPGEVYVSEPYEDANTKEMCCTVSKLLSDGETVLAIDLNFSKAQEAIQKMATDKGETALIVTEGGLIVGYSDMALLGASATEKLPEFATVLSRVVSSRTHDTFRVTLDGQAHIIFSAETSNHWYLILSVSERELYSESQRQIVSLVAVNLLLLSVVVFFYILNTRNRLQARGALERTRGHLGDFSERLHVLARRVLHLGDARLSRGEADGEEIAGYVREAGEQLSVLSDEMSSYVEVLHMQQEAREDKGWRKGHSASLPSKRIRTAVSCILLVTLVLTMVFCVNVAIGWSEEQLGREADRNENQLDAWIVEQTSIVNMFTDTISANPAIMDDYNGAVRWLDSVASHYPSISACYMANPYADIPVIMNTGWMPGEDERPETRPWYKATERSSNHFSISDPYFDIPTGNYCVTFSRVVYGENDEFLGIFGCDFFLDQLMGVLGESYTSTSYAFLIDTNGTIINHPNKAYESDDGVGVSIEDTEYADAYHSAGSSVVRDFSGQYVSCLTRHVDSGFTVMVAIRWWSIFGQVLLMMLALVTLYGLCVVCVIYLINRLTRWQEGVNRQLV